MNSSSISGPSNGESVFLDRLYQATGLHFDQIGEIDLRDRSIMSAVLPVAAELLPTFTDFGDRIDVLYLFTSPHANAFAEKMVSWIEVEPNRAVQGIILNILTQRLRKRDADLASRIWRFLEKRLDEVDNGYRMAVKLLEYDSTRAAVRVRVLERLRSGRISEGGRRDLLKSKDEDLKVELKAPQDRQSPVRLPEGFRWAKVTRNLPDRTRELMSAEIDLADFSSTVESYGLRGILTGNANGSLEPIEVDVWYVADAADASGAFFEVWVRLEDLDVVEAIVLRTDIGRRKQ